MPASLRSALHALALSALAGSAHAADWLTYAGSAQRLGTNSLETALTPATVPNLKLHWSRSVRGTSQTQPLFKSGVLINNKTTQDEVFQVTAKGAVVALNAATSTIDWTTNLPVSVSPLGSCVPNGMGIMGTPTIDPVAQIMYVVDGLGALHALAIGTGQEMAGYPVQIIDSANYAQGSFNHSSPTLVGTTLYITTSGQGKCELANAHYQGAVIAFNTATLAIAQTYFPVTDPTGGGGIWGPGGVMSDPITGRLFVATGNAQGSVSTKPDGESVVALDANLTRLDADSPGLPWLPPGGDYDFATTPTPLDTPNCPPLLAALNKTGYLFIFNRSALAGGPTQVLRLSKGGGSSDFIGMGAYDPATQMMFINNPIASADGTVANGGVAFSYTAPGCTLVQAWQHAFGADVYSRYTHATDPVVAGGIVWFSSGAAGLVVALSEADGSHLWDSGTIMTSPTQGSVTVANGQVFVQSGSRLYAFGL